MAPSAGHILVPKVIKFFRFAIDKATRVIKDKLPQTLETVQAKTQPVLVRATVQQPINRLAAIRQTQSRWYSTKQAINRSVRHLSSIAESSAPRLRSSYPSSRTATAVSRLTTRAPFASTLRPNLTGGALGRTAGGYGLGAQGVRHFSHSPAAPAEVINSVSQAVRAFWLSGSKARFNGYNPQTGEKRFRAISTLQEEARHKMDMSSKYATGSYVDFKVSPTMTAIGPLSSVPRSTSASTTCDDETVVITDPAFITNLSVDFARALKDLAAIMNDLKNLSKLGDLPITLHDRTTLRVNFPGCDADTVEGLCTELNIRRGIVGEDPDFPTQNGTEMALLFPFAPSKAASEFDLYEYRPAKLAKRIQCEDIEWHDMYESPPAKKFQSPGQSNQSIQSGGEDLVEDESREADLEMVENPWLSNPSGYSSLHTSEIHQEEHEYQYRPHDAWPRVGEMPTAPSTQQEGNGYEGLEGIYRFLEECDRARR